MKIDLSNIPVIDNHCHPFVLGREPEVFAKNFCIGLYPVSEENMKSTIYYQQVINALRKFFNLPETATEEEVVALRNKYAQEDRVNYAHKLFESQNIKGFLCDFGFPISQITNPENKLTDSEIKEYRDACEGYTDIYNIDRIEWVANRIVEEEPSFDEFESRLVKDTKKLVQEKNLIALKSVVAYYTGLDVRPLSRDEFKKGYYLYLYDPDNWEYRKMFHDFIFIKACEICRELDIPLQVHTGLGDTPHCHIVRVNPANLTDALNDPRVMGTTIVLIHGGYPYCEELGMLVNHFEHVYCDCSSFIPFAGIAAYDKLKALLELCPTKKLFFGTDAGLILEGLWFGTMNFKKVYARILEELIDDGYITYEFAMQSAEDILYNNVKRVYKLK
ncbi:TatD family hydrolase [Ruminococcus sp. YH-rum2234]|uniref:TatD family hydrolase n=2 Tax=Fusibacillus kribbianus TaxID=3044208 RepID=A0AAP4EYY3_9FIRM|nr:TatD family hydrolase [Ruminococcus sp. YH-rum2234]